MHDLWIAKRVVGLLCAPLLGSCLLLIDTTERQCKTNADCTSADLGTMCVEQVCVSAGCQGDSCTSTEPSRDGKCENDAQCADSTPRCLNETCVSSQVGAQWICQAEDMVRTNNMVRFSFHIIDFLSRQPPKNIVVNACLSHDVACAEPVSMYVDSDGTGHAQLEIPAGFVGFFEVKSESLTTLLYVTKPIWKNTSSQDLPILSMDALKLTAQITLLTIDPSTGLALLQALDCSDTPAAGVSFKLRGEGTETANSFYMVDQIPSLDAKLTTYDQISKAATGGFINVKPGFVFFSAYVGASENAPLIGEFNAVIRANTITYIDMHF